MHVGMQVVMHVCICTYICTRVRMRVGEYAHDPACMQIKVRVCMKVHTWVTGVGFTDIDLHLPEFVKLVSAMFNNCLVGWMSMCCVVFWCWCDAMQHDVLILRYVML